MQPDLSHATQQEAFYRALLHQDPPPGISAPVPAMQKARFAVYRNNMLHSLTRALAQRFVVVEQLVGTAFFAATARAFIAAHPPTSPVLLHWGAEFAPFLDHFAPAAALPFLGDVARLEYARGQAYHAADCAAITQDKLAVADPAALRLVLHPSVTLFYSQHPAVQIWQAHQAGAPKIPLKAGPDYALIGRKPDFSILVAALDAPNYQLISQLAAGVPLGRAAREIDPTTMLSLLLQQGFIIDATITKGPCP
jgi:hypothetical protein